jgi:ribonuclease D
LESIVNEIQLAEMVSVDLETTGLNPRIDRIRLISLATAKGTWLIDCFEVDPHLLFRVLAHKKLVMHNGAFDLGFLFAVGFELKEGAEVMDTMLLSQILEDKETA